jgi:hypothetical protein
MAPETGKQVQDSDRENNGTSESKWIETLCYQDVQEFGVCQPNRFIKGKFRYAGEYPYLAL